MADRPILFSAPMVQAVLDGRKTQTRRIIHPATLWAGEYPGHDHWDESDFAPRFAVGDRLWVKETHACVGDGGRWLLFRASGYEAECDRHGFDKPYPPESDVKWKPSIFMRREFSRLTLTVTDVRVQRLQDISEEDARAEGIYFDKLGYTAGRIGMRDCNQEWSATPEIAYANLWRKINGAGSWEANPWVVAVSFDVRKGNIDG